jgi:hypothetical protein
MLTRDYRYIIGGALLILLGLYAGIHAWTSYSVGTVTHMGPGMFPAALGFLLAVLGVGIFLPALFRSGTLPRPEYRPLIATLISILLFAATIRTAGLIPAVALLTVAAVLADNKLGVIATVILSAVLALFAALVFIVGLGMPLQLFIWPDRWL